MHFTNLRINNFLTLGEGVHLNLASKGLNLLQGVNSDDTSANSNGAGKSSVVDALCWCLFGSTARGESGDSVVNRTAKKNCLVSVDVVDGSTTYRIARGRKHATLKNSSTLEMLPLGGAPVPLTKGTEKETQAEIVKVLGCTEDVFVASIYAGQEQMPDIPAMTDKNLKMLIEQAAGITRLEKAYTAALDEVRTAKNSFETVQNQLASAKSSVHGSEVHLETLKLKAAEADTTKGTAIASAQAELETKRRTLVERKTTFESAQPKISAAVAKQAEIQASLANIKNAQAAVDAYVANELRKAQRDFDNAAYNEGQATERARAAKHRLDNAADELAKPCSACGKPHTPEELDQLKVHLGEELKKSLQALRTAKAAVYTAGSQLETAKAQADNLRKLVPDATELTATNSRINTALEPLRKLGAEITALEAAIEFDARSIATMRAAPNPHASAIEHVQKVIEEGKWRVAELTKLTTDLEDELKVREGVAKTFSPAGVRAHILDTVTPFLNDRTATYLGTLSDGNITAIWSTLSRTAKGELREKFEIEVSHAKGGDSFKLLSGGEKRKVRLACMLALQDLVASRASKPIDLWIGDEIDDALDPAGLERLMTLLETKARERGTVVVVSHGDLRDWIDEVTVIEKKGGTSSVTGSLCEV